MRIIGGAFRGKKIIAPAALPVRPTTDFAKTGLFNIINNRYNLATVHVLDLFAGIGSITFEFISRGCKKINAVDRNAACISFIKQTAEKINASPVYKIIHADAITYIEKTQETFDIIFADPPFEMDNAPVLHKIVKERKLLNPGGMLVLEHSSDKNHGSLPGFIEARKYGHVTFSFFRHDDDFVNSQKDL